MRLREIHARELVQAAGNLLVTGELAAARALGRLIAAWPVVALALVEGIEQAAAERARADLARDGVVGATDSPPPEQRCTPYTYDGVVVAPR